MKKILFALIALVCSMSINAQVMKVMKGNTVVATYTAEQADNVVFEEAQASTTGTAKRTGDIDVNWVQLWENGPKFAEYNIGAVNNKAEDYGGYYGWGKSVDKDPNQSFVGGSSDLSSDDDTAINLWGSNWRMPTRDELQALLNNCDVVWTSVEGVNGRKFTGRGDYSDNSVFLPAAGYWNNNNLSQSTSNGYYWSSSNHSRDNFSQSLDFESGKQEIDFNWSKQGYSVRAVLAE